MRRMGAATLRMYPLTARLWAFSAPLWAMLAAAGIRAATRKVRADASVRAGLVAAAALLATAGIDAGWSLTNPYWHRAHMRPLIRTLEEAQRSTGDAIYVMPRAAPQWLFYTTPWRTDPAPVRRDSAAQWLEQRTCERKSTERVRTCQMIGAYSSAKYTEVGGFVGAADSAWANREAERVRTAAAPCAWVLMHLPYPGEPAALAHALETHGGRVDNALEDRMHPNRDAATRAFRICFDGRESGT